MTEGAETEPYKPGPNAVDLTEAQDGGLLKEVIKEGEGEASPLTGDQVYVHYIGKTLDGKTFDSSRDRKQEFWFPVGIGLCDAFPFNISQHPH